MSSGLLGERRRELQLCCGVEGEAGAQRRGDPGVPGTHKGTINRSLPRKAQGTRERPQGRGDI